MYTEADSVELWTRLLKKFKCGEVNKYRIAGYGELFCIPFKFEKFDWIMGVIVGKRKGLTEFHIILDLQKEIVADRLIVSVAISYEKEYLGYLPLKDMRKRIKGNVNQWCGGLEEAYKKFRRWMMDAPHLMRVAIKQLQDIEQSSVSALTGGLPGLGKRR